MERRRQLGGQSRSRSSAFSEEGIVVVVVGSGEVDSDSMHAADVSSEEATGVVGSFVLAAGTYEVGRVEMWCSGRVGAKSFSRSWSALA
jgi:hypothetical protein